MSRIRYWSVAALACFLWLTALPSSAAGGERSARHQEYVVGYDGDLTWARRAIAEAGGRVLDVNPAVHLALVEADADEFLDQVGRHKGVRGAAPNHIIGTTKPGMPHRFADQPLGPSLRSRVATRHDVQLDPTAPETPLTTGSPDPVPPSDPATDPGTPTDPPSEASPGATPPSDQEPAPKQDQAPKDEAVPDPPAEAPAPEPPAPPAEPLEHRQWNMAMVGATPEQAHRVLTGAGVDVGIIDTGIDASHPDIAPNYDAERSRNFTVDRPELDGPCEVRTCVDPPDIDDRGHGTHVAALVGAARNGFGMVGVAPEVNLVNLRAGQESGYFFVYETVDALVAAGDLGLDVVTMSFYTDPWLYNCTSRDEYISGEVTETELDQQRLIRRVVIDALEYAHERGVTLIAAAGNEHTDLAAPQRVDPFVPSRDGTPRTRTVRNSCLNLPSEGPNVMSVAATGPSGTKADYSNYGHGKVHLAAPGGWIGDPYTSLGYRSPENLVLSAYPTSAATAQELANTEGDPLSQLSQRWCDAAGACGFYTYMQGTSMAAPHVAGVAALIIEREGEGAAESGYSLDPDTVAAHLAETAVDQPCPATGALSYRAVGRSADWDAMCEGSAGSNGLYGEGIVHAPPP